MVSLFSIHSPPHYGYELYEIDAWSTVGFVRQLACLLALLTHFLAPRCSLHVARFSLLPSFVRLLHHSFAFKRMRSRRV